MLERVLGMFDACDPSCRSAAARKSSRRRSIRLCESVGVEWQIDSFARPGAWRSQQGTHGMFRKTCATEWLGHMPLRHRRAVKPRLGTSVAILLVLPRRHGRRRQILGRCFSPYRKAMGSASETCFAEVGMEIHQKGPRSEADVAKQHEGPGCVLLLTPFSKQARFRRRFARQRKRKDVGGAS